MRQALKLAFLGLVLTSVSQLAEAKKNEPRERAVAPPHFATDNPAAEKRMRELAALSLDDTTFLHSADFDNGVNCDPQGWTSVDLTAEPGDFWHVDNYAGLSFGPIAGTKSLWCGVRAGAVPEFCQYLALPGYGNGWDQSWRSKNCIAIAGGSTANLDVSFLIRYDTEASYDYTVLEYTTDCTGESGWLPLQGGAPAWTGAASLNINNAYPVGGANVRVRLRFVSDGSWSDQDGFVDTDGAVHIDNLKVENLAVEDFEGESVGANSTADWESAHDTGFGDYAGLFKGSTLLQEDMCKTNLSCMWAFIKNSTANYACAGHPGQAVVPYGPVNDGQYISNEVWSPLIPLDGSGSRLNVDFDVYRDLEELAQVYYTLRVRTIAADGCPGPWKNNAIYNSGTFADNAWYRHIEDIGEFVDFVNGTHVQVALGVIDMCPVFCGWSGTSGCHSHAPLFDNVRVYRVGVDGPHWSVRESWTFQDTFSEDGTITGTARADMAQDIEPYDFGVINPGDSAVVFYLQDPAYAGTGTNTSGLLSDPNISTFAGRHKTKKQAYLHVAVWPLGQPGKSGAPLSEGPGGQANRYPFMGTVAAGGVTWTKIRMDYTYTGIGLTGQPILNNRFNVDLNDNLFEPGDTICYFFSATSAGGTTYYSSNWPITDNIEEVASNPTEFTILPAGGFNRGGNILYVDGADGFGNQTQIESAFLALGIADRVDRYDVRGPNSRPGGGVNNRLDGRVHDVQQQLNDAYQIILWDTGSLRETLGANDFGQETDEYGLLNTFLGNLTNPGGVYLCGDHIAEQLAVFSLPSAATFRTLYMPFTLTSHNHKGSAFGVSPKIHHWPGRCFNDDFLALSNCTPVFGFDVMGASGSSLVEMSYGGPQSPNGAVVSNVNGSARVLLAGFSVAAIRDDEADGVFDRAKHIRDAIVWLGTSMPGATGANATLRNSLAQNYPNPFNPQTTIAFSLATRGHVRLAVYDVNGALVRGVVDETRVAGGHAATWDGRDERGVRVASGVYFYRLTTPTFSQTRKMVLLK